MSVTISELQDLERYDDNDVLFVSKKNTTAGEPNEIYESYKYKLINLHNVISTDVFNRMSPQVENWVKRLEEFNNDRYDKLLTDFKGKYDNHLEECNMIHDNLSGEWYTLSNTLCTDYKEFKEWVIEQLNDLSNYKADKTELVTVTGNLSDEIEVLKNKLTELSTWVSDNFVDKTTDQEINGTKTFKKVIKGIAEKAQWA
jgi:hypothetical protein